MPWPAHICRKSDRLLDTETSRHRFYPVYNAILNQCFPQDRYSICPQYVTLLEQTEGIDVVGYAISYVVVALESNSIVLFIEVRPPSELDHRSWRTYVDIQMRERFGEMVHLVKVPKFFGISAFGRRLCYYTYDAATNIMEPPKIPRSRLDMDIAPLERWDSNIMEEDGYDRFLAIVRDIQDMVDALDDGNG